MLNQSQVFLESHNIRNRASGFGQFNYHLIKALSELNPEHLEFVIHSKASPEFKSDFNSRIKYRTYFQFTRYQHFRIRKRYDLWHSLNQNTKIEPAYDLPYVLTVHDVNFIEEQSDDMNHERNIRFQEKLDRSHAITYISNFSKKETHKYFKVPDVPEYVIYNGNTINDIDLPENHVPSIRPSRPYLFSIGEFRERKNLHTLVQMLCYLPDYDLVLSGKKDTKYFEHTVAKVIKTMKLEDRVFITGKISEWDKYYYMQHCAAYVFPSLREGFGIPIIEAMRFGKPVFASNNTSMPEIGGPHAYYWDNLEPEYMANTLKEGLLRYNSDKAKLTKSYINHAQSFDWAYAAQKYVEVYRTVLDQVRSA